MEDGRARHVTAGSCHLQCTDLHPAEPGPCARPRCSSPGRTPATEGEDSRSITGQDPKQGETWGVSWKDGCLWPIGYLSAAGCASSVLSPGVSTARYCAGHRPFRGHQVLRYHNFLLAVPLVHWFAFSRSTLAASPSDLGQTVLSCPCAIFDYCLSLPPPPLLAHSHTAGAVLLDRTSPPCLSAAPPFTVGKLKFALTGTLAAW